MSTLRQNLAFLMHKHQITANTLAKETGVPQPTISRILNGESSDPRTLTVQPIAERFGLDVEDMRSKLIDGAGDFTPTAAKLELLGKVGQPPSIRTQSIARKGQQQAISEKLRNANIYCELVLPQQRKESTENFEIEQLDYVSPKLALEWKVLPYSKKFQIPQGSHSRYEGLQAALWRLLALKSEAPDRAYILAILFVDIDNAPDEIEPLDAQDYFVQWAPLPPALSKLSAQASLYGVSVMVSTPKHLVGIIEEIETRS